MHFILTQQMVVMIKRVYFLFNCRILLDLILHLSKIRLEPMMEFEDRH